VVTSATVDVHFGLVCASRQGQLCYYCAVTHLFAVLILSIACAFTAHAQDTYVSGAPSAFIQTRLFGTTSASQITAVALTLDGRVVVAGNTTDANLLARAPGLWQTKASSNESFVAVLSPRLDRILAWTFIGGSQEDRVIGLALSRSGDVAVVGTTSSADLPTTGGAYNQAYGGAHDGFIYVLSSTLDTLRFCSYIGGTGNDVANAVACDGSGNFVVVGQTSSRTTFRTVNAYAATFHGGESDAYVSKFNPSGGVVFSTYFGSVGTDAFRAVTVANDGTIITTGSTSSETFEVWPRRLTPWDPNTAKPFDPTFNGGLTDAVVVAFSSDGSRLVFSSFLGGLESESGLAITTTPSGRIAVVGETNSPNFPVQASSDSHKGQRDIFVAFVRHDGQQLIASRLYGGLQDDVPCFVGAVTNDQVLVVGWSASHDVLPTAEGSTTALQGDADMLALRVASTGILYAGRFGWHGSDKALAAAMDSEGDLYIGGASTSTNISATESSAMAASADAPLVGHFVFGAVELASPKGGDRWCQGTPVTLSWFARNMKPNDDYMVQIAEPGKDAWETVVPPQAELRATWNPSTHLVGSLFDLRLVSRRGHEMRTVDPIVLRVPANVRLSPASAADCRGNSVTLTVTASGTDLQYQWRKNGRAMAGVIGPQLTIAALDEDNEGTYDVQVVSSCGSPVTSGAATVLLTPSTVLTREPLDRSIAAGTTLRLHVAAEGANLRYQWFHEGSPLEEQTGPTLEIPHASAVHRGRYHATVTGSCGTVLSRSALVAIDGTTSVASHQAMSTVVWHTANPASTRIRCTVGGLFHQGIIVDALGVVVAFATLGNHPNGTDVSAHVETLASGAYSVVLVGQGQTRTIPFLVQR